MATKRTLPLSALQQHLTVLFDNGPHALAPPYEDWLTTSKPFVSFAQTYQQKIRKKVKMARDGEEMHNVYCELRTAYVLLQDPRLAVEYEPYAIQHGRSPDFAVTYRTHTTFHVEVTRLRGSQQEPWRESQSDEAGDGPAQSPGSARHYAGGRLADVVCAKLGQLAPETPNILWIWLHSMPVQEMDIAQTLLALKRNVEQRDAETLARHRFRHPADFMRLYQRLSAILVQSLHTGAAGQRPLIWNNNDARHSLPAKIGDLLGALVASDPSQAFVPDPISGRAEG